MRYFELFGLTPNYNIDLTSLAARYRELQKAVHPDRYASGSEREKLLAVQQAAEINDAFQTLKHPLSRAEYILSQRGVELAHEQKTVNDTAFLMQQMEWREALAELALQRDPEQAITALEQEFSTLQQQLYAELIPMLEANNADLSLAANLIRKLKFVYKLQSELERIEDTLFDD